MAMTNNKCFLSHTPIAHGFLILGLLLTSCAPVKPQIGYPLEGYWVVKPTYVHISCCLDNQMNAYAGELADIFSKNNLHCSPKGEATSDMFKLDWNGPYYVDGISGEVAVTFWWELTGFMEGAVWSQMGDRFEIHFYCDDVDSTRWFSIFFCSESEDSISMCIYSSPKRNISPSLSESSSSNNGYEYADVPTLLADYRLLIIHYEYVSRQENSSFSPLLPL